MARTGCRGPHGMDCPAGDVAAMSFDSLKPVNRFMICSRLSPGLKTGKVRQKGGRRELLPLVGGSPAINIFEFMFDFVLRVW